MKKWICLLLLCLLLLCGAAVAEEPEVHIYEEYGYVLREDGTIELIGYIGEVTELTIPAQIEGRPVTSIGPSAFYECEALTSVSLPASVTSIGEYAFYRCKALTSVSVRDSGESVIIQDDAMSEEQSMIVLGMLLADMLNGDGGTNTEDWATVGDSLFGGMLDEDTEKHIGASAFYGCRELTDVTIPEGVTRIGEAAFYNCKSLTDVTIPVSVTSIESEAFYGCSSMTTMSIPDSDIFVSRSAFSNCDSLTLPAKSGSLRMYAVVDWGVPCILYTELEDGTLSISGYKGDIWDVVIPAQINGKAVTDIRKNALNSCDSVKTVMIPDSVTSIGEGAFGYCETLKSVSIPASVTSIGDKAFRRSPLLKLTVERDAYAEQYAKENDVPYIYSDEND